MSTVLLHRLERSLRLVCLMCLGLAAASIVAGCSGDEPAQDTTTVPQGTDVPATTAAPGPPPGAEVVGLRDLAVGDCFDTVDEPAVRDLAVWRIDCEQPHRFEVYDVLDYDGPREGGYPGVETVQDWSEQACYERFEDFVGVRWTVSELDLQVWWPSSDSWAIGDESVICTVRPDGTQRLSGSQRGSQR